MLDKIKNYRHHPKLQELQDVRILGQFAFLVIVLMVSWSGVKVIQTNYELQQQISRLQQETAVQELANENQRLKNEYYNTPQYLELAARQNFGLAAPGEKVLLVPKEVALAHVPAESEVKAMVETAAKDTRPFYSRNYQDWIDFMLNRQKSI